MAAPATVSGESANNMATGFVWEGRLPATTREPGDLPSCVLQAATGRFELTPIRTFLVRKAAGDTAKRNPFGIVANHSEGIMSVFNSATATSPVTTTRAPVLLPSAMAVLFGALMLGLVGFSSMDVVHNAAHDTRHANAFPCH